MFFTIHPSLTHLREGRERRRRALGKWRKSMWKGKKFIHIKVFLSSNPQKPWTLTFSSPTPTGICFSLIFFGVKGCEKMKKRFNVFIALLLLPVMLGLYPYTHLLCSNIRIKSSVSLIVIDVEKENLINKSHWVEKGLKIGQSHFIWLCLCR